MRGIGFFPAAFAGGIFLLDHPIPAAPGCPVFLDSIRQAYERGNPAYLYWDADARPCGEAEIQEALYLQGLGFAILRREDLASVFWERAMILEGPWREKSMRQLLRSSRARGDSAEAAFYVALLQIEFPASSTRLPAFSADAIAEKTWATRTGFSTRHALRSHRSPTYGHDLLSNQLELNWSARKGRMSLRTFWSGDWTTGLETALPQRPGDFFGEMGKSEPEQFSTMAGLIGVYRGWQGAASAGQIYDFGRIADDSLPSMTRREGWTGPAWNISAGYTAPIAKGHGNATAMLARLREDWTVGIFSASLSHAARGWLFDYAGSGEWHRITRIDSVLPGFPQTSAYRGFWSLAGEFSALRPSGPHATGFRGQYEFQRDRYSGEDPLRLTGKPGTRQTLAGFGEYRHQGRVALTAQAGGGYEWNRDAGSPSGPVFKAGFGLQWGR